MIYALAAVLAGCSGSEDDPNPNPEQKGTVCFNPSINLMSKATDTGFESNDAIGVFAFKNANGFTDNGYAKNIKHTYVGSYFTSPSGGISYPSKNEGLAFYAVYPYNASAASQFTFSVNSDQSQGKNYTLSDLMTASTAITSQEIPNLKFDHRLVNIIINLQFDKAPLGSVDLSFSAKRNTSVNLTANSFTASGSASTIKAAPNGTNSFKVILPPQTISEGTKLVSFVVNGETWTWTLNQDLVFKSGMQYRYTLNVENNTRSLSYTGGINPWGEEPRIETVVPPTILDKMKPYITVYEGINPPNINGCFIIDPMCAVYCEDQGNGGYNPGDKVISTLVKFSNQNNNKLTLDYVDRAINGQSDIAGHGAYISGSGNNFTAFFNTEGTMSEIPVRTALVISGTKNSTGISNIRYAFVMVDKGSDPENKLMKEGVFRVFKDVDGLAQNANWSTTKSFSENLNLLNCMSNKNN